ncbi:MAG: peptide MFS transporter [bacterium]|nr:peptide MFS transporter [bacterium]
MSEPTAASPPTPPVTERRLGATYWMCNAIEMWERLAYYVLRPIAPIYICQASEPGGLHLPQATKGWIYMWWAIFQSFLPMVTGGYADRYGYKKTLSFAVTMNIFGYLLMAYTHSYLGFFAGIITLAIGTAFFKPALQGTIAHQLTEGTSSLGWGIFYWVVNVGSVLGHYISPLLLGQPHSSDGWRNVFLFCAACTAMNYLMLFTFKDVPSGASKSESPLQVLRRTIVNVVEPRLITWLLIMSCFWLMMYQLWDLQPNFIEDWIDSSMVAAYMPFDSWQEMGDRGLIRVPQQVLISLNALLIVFFMVPVSWLVRKMRTLSAMLIGMLIATAGVLVAGLTDNGWILLLGIICFSLGEMLTGPKKNQYLSLIAPPGKKGLYLGYVNIPIGIGVGFGSWIAGHVYGTYGEKATLALKEMATRPALLARAAQASDWSDALELVPTLTGLNRAEAFDTACAHLKMNNEQGADALRRLFANDRGQITNLALLYMSASEQYRDSVAAELPKVLQEERYRPLGDGLGTRLADGTATPAEVKPAAWVSALPAALGENRASAFGRVCTMVNEDQPSGQGLDDGEVVELLWQRFGDDPEVLNNLALEYLAQASDLVHDAAQRMAFQHPVEAMGERIGEIEKRLGIGRTKSFPALSAATGADPAAVDQELGKLDVPTQNLADRAFVYLVNQEYQRFAAVARKDWSRDRKLLRALIGSDEAALRVVLAGIDHSTLGERVMGWLGSGDDPADVTPEGVNYTRLAGKQDLIQLALAAKDWSQVPDQAAHLLGLNPYEARAVVAAEINHSGLTTTKHLWDRYGPQYRVWIPFAAIGVIAAIALFIFGQLAKRWDDMNA